MKKFVAIIAIMAVCLSFIACDRTSTSPTEAATEPATESLPNAKEFPEITWPTFGAATKIPTPDWSSNGKILADSETTLWVQVGYSTLDDFNNYVKACQDAGYTEDYYNVPGYIYYGADSDNYAVLLTYNEYDHYIAIQVTANAAEWDKWWAEKDD